LNLFLFSYALFIISSRKKYLRRRPSFSVTAVYGRFNLTYTTDYELTVNRSATTAPSHRGCTQESILTKRLGARLYKIIIVAACAYFLKKYEKLGSNVIWH
jgi:hypothetical protein